MNKLTASWGSSDHISISDEEWERDFLKRSSKEIEDQINRSIRKDMAGYHEHWDVLHDRFGNILDIYPDVVPSKSIYSAYHLKNFLLLCKALISPKFSSYEKFWWK
jgi:hypothetical protein